MSLAFPRADLYWLSWFMLVPLMYYTYQLTLHRALMCGMTFGMGFFAALLYWITIFGKFPWIALSIMEALFIAGFVVTAKLIGSKLSSWGRLVLLPVLWVIFEWIRSLGMLGFSWGDIGYSQYKVLPVVQLASFTGIWGISFLLALSNAALANWAIERRNRRPLGSAHIQISLVLLIVMAVFFFGSAAVREQIAPEGRVIRAVIIQGNIGQTSREADWLIRSWDTYRNMTLSERKKDVDLVVWPEAVVPGCLGRDRYTQQRLSDLAGDVGAHLFVGGFDYDNYGNNYNTAFLIGPKSGILGKYAKVHLVPFGEFVPARGYIPFLRYYMVRSTTTSSGSGYNLLDTGSYKIGTAICFESAFAYTLRRMTASGADLLCVITDDEWFGRTSAAEQHMIKSVFRAVENRRYILHGAATGISCIIDPQGRIIHKTGIFRSGVVRGKVHTLSGKTFYTRYGDWLAGISVIIVCIQALIAFTRTKSEKDKV